MRSTLPACRLRSRSHSQANPFAAPAATAANPFAAPAATAANPFAAPAASAANPFGAPAATAANPFGAPAATAANPFGAPAATAAPAAPAAGIPGASTSRRAAVEAIGCFKWFQDPPRPAPPAAAAPLYGQPAPPPQPTFSPPQDVEREYAQLRVAYSNLPIREGQVTAAPAPVYGVPQPPQVQGSDRILHAPFVRKIFVPARQDRDYQPPLLCQLDCQGNLVKTSQGQPQLVPLLSQSEMRAVRRRLGRRVKHEDEDEEEDGATGQLSVPTVIIGFQGLTKFSKQLQSRAESITSKAEVSDVVAARSRGGRSACPHHSGPFRGAPALQLQRRSRPPSASSRALPRECLRVLRDTASPPRSPAAQTLAVRRSCKPTWGPSWRTCRACPRKWTGWRRASGAAAGAACRPRTMWPSRSLGQGSAPSRMRKGC